MKIDRYNIWTLSNIVQDDIAPDGKYCLYSDVEKLIDDKAKETCNMVRDYTKWPHKHYKRSCDGIKFVAWHGKYCSECGKLIKVIHKP